jgi:hypothetical protein
MYSKKRIRSKKPFTAEREPSFERDEKDPVRTGQHPIIPDVSMEE